MKFLKLDYPVNYPVSVVRNNTTNKYYRETIRKPVLVSHIARKNEPNLLPEIENPKYGTTENDIRYIFLCMKYFFRTYCE